MIDEKKFVPQHSATLVEQVTEFMTNSVLEGRFKNGQRLVENELQRKFGVSRAPIRESFRILERSGLVNIIPRKGAFIRKITKKDVEENFPIRAYLEGLAARLAVLNIKPNEIKIMELYLSKMTKAATENDFKLYFMHHVEFHEIFITASKNDTLIEILKNLRRQAVWFRFSYLWHQENFEYAIRVHREILHYFTKGDSDGAENLVKEHILVALKTFLGFLTLRKETEAENETI